MLSKSAIHRIVPILRKELQRARRMYIRGFPRPCYVSFLLSDTRWFNTWAGSGSVYRRKAGHSRHIYCDMRVGSYRYDQVTHGGLNDHGEDEESYSHTDIPIDDNHYDGLRIGLWRLTDAKFREAIADYTQRKATAISNIDLNKGLNSYTRQTRRHHIRYARPEWIDEDQWVRYCRNASRWIAALPGVSSGWVEFDATQLSKIFVNTEGSVIVQHSQVYSLVVTLRLLTKDGAQLEQELVLNCATQRELPDGRKLKRIVLEKHEQLRALSKAKKIHSFSGPVLLYPTPAGLLMHEAIGHRVEGTRLLSTSEGQTFKDQVGKRVVNVDLTFRDNPQLKSFKGQKCIGSYEFDDEGAEAEDAICIEEGVLKGFLTTRAQHTKDPHHSNGHARNRKHERPISRMGVTIVTASNALSMEELKQKLVNEIKSQGRPYGMIIYETSGGETETQSYDFQAFSGEISYATLIYPDGREVLVRGVDFVGTPLQALNNIVAIGNELEMNNGYCGAESGFLPITTISPAILLSSLELQSKSEEPVTQYLLPKPRMS